MFTREFIIDFDASPADIAAWLAASPGIADATQRVERDERIYAIKPGGGAQFAELAFDTKKNHIRIRTYWS
jgi:hypothetical protein